MSDSGNSLFATALDQFNRGADLIDLSDDEELTENEDLERMFSFPVMQEEPEDKVQEAVDTVTRMETEMVEMRREATDLKAQVFELLTTAKILEMNAPAG